MWQHHRPAPPGLAPGVPAAPKIDEWNRTVDKFLALEVNATRNEVAHAVWHGRCSPSSHPDGFR